jgi:hypothetical protein
VTSDPSDYLNSAKHCTQAPIQLSNVYLGSKMAGVLPLLRVCARLCKQRMHTNMLTDQYANQLNLFTLGDIRRWKSGSHTVSHTRAFCSTRTLCPATFPHHAVLLDFQWMEIPSAMPSQRLVAHSLVTANEVRSL